MPSTQTKVAVGLPVYNGQTFLASTLECLLGQTYGNFELIISDNASTDRTEEICREYAQRDGRIRYVRQPENLGAIPNFNRVFEISNAPYFKWAAVDDRCDPTYLAKAAQVLDENPDVAWCHSKSSHIDASGQWLDDPESLNVSYLEREADTPSARFKAILLGNKGSLDSYGLFRSEALRKTPLFLPYYGPEKVLIAELGLLGRYQEIPEVLFFPRVLAEGSGNKKTAVEQQTFVDTKHVRRLQLTRLRFLQGYLRAIGRSAPNWTEATKSHLAVLQWLFQVSKWHAVVLKAVRGQGVGGGNVERVKRIESKRGQAEDHLKQPAGSTWGFGTKDHT